MVRLIAVFANMTALMLVVDCALGGYDGQYNSQSVQQRPSTPDYQQSQYGEGPQSHDGHGHTKKSAKTSVVEIGSAAYRFYKNYNKKDRAQQGSPGQPSTPSGRPSYDLDRLIASGGRKYDRAIKYYNKNVRSTPSGRPSYDLDRVMASGGRKYDRASKYYNKYVRSTPSGRPSYLDRLIASGGRKYDRASKYYNKYVRSTPSGRPSYDLDRVMASGGRKYGRASKYYNKQRALYRRFKAPITGSSHYRKPAPKSHHNHQAVKNFQPRRLSAWDRLKAKQARMAAYYKAKKAEVRARVAREEEYQRSRSGYQNGGR